MISILGLLTVSLRLKKVRREYAVLRGEGKDVDVVTIVNRFGKRLDALNGRVDSVVADQEEQAASGRFAVQRFGLVRYDAFEDMGGQLSFSAALLDDYGDGLVISSINGRSETRTYGKPIRDQSSEHNLSEEERAAIAAAMSGYDRGKSPAQMDRVHLRAEQRGLGLSRWTFRGQRQLRDHFQTIAKDPRQLQTASERHAPQLELHAGNRLRLPI